MLKLATALLAVAGCTAFDTTSTVQVNFVSDGAQDTVAVVFFLYSHRITVTAVSLNCDVESPLGAERFPGFGAFNVVSTTIQFQAGNLATVDCDFLDSDVTSSGTPSDTCFEINSRLLPAHSVRKDKPLHACARSASFKGLCGGIYAEGIACIDGYEKEDDFERTVHVIETRDTIRLLSWAYLDHLYSNPTIRHSFLFVYLQEK